MTVERTAPTNGTEEHGQDASAECRDCGERYRFSDYIDAAIRPTAASTALRSAGSAWEPA
jgi:hypothetical protein